MLKNRVEKVFSKLKQKVLKRYRREEKRKSNIWIIGAPGKEHREKEITKETIWRIFPEFQTGDCKLTRPIGLSSLLNMQR